MKNTIEKIDMDDQFVCHCGNTASTNGFEPCNEFGDIVDPLPSWDGFYKCNDCGQIYSPN